MKKREISITVPPPIDISNILTFLKSFPKIRRKNESHKKESPMIKHSIVRQNTKRELFQS